MPTTTSFPSSVSTNSVNANNTFADDGTNTSAIFSTTSAITWSGFSSLSIPSGATINGITISVEASSNSFGVSPQIRVYNGTSYSSSVAANTWPSNKAVGVHTFGGASDLWGLSWTPTTAAGISFEFAFSYMTSGRVMFADYITITVTYTTGSSPTVHTVNTVAEANIATIKGVAHVNIAEINTVTFD
tara:strand:- start:32 stop:595 length:564 start_codon:yes stop_codon:yes gene_type:complete